jgi:hypothetical protein
MIGSNKKAPPRYHAASESDILHNQCSLQAVYSQVCGPTSRLIFQHEKASTRTGGAEEKMGCWIRMQAKRSLPTSSGPVTVSCAPIKECAVGWGRVVSSGWARGPNVDHVRLWDDGFVGGFLASVILNRPFRFRGHSIHRTPLIMIMQCEEGVTSVSCAD